MPLLQLLGEYDVKMDAKGRFRMPSSLLNQLGDLRDEKFIVNRGFERCLVLYPQPLWERTAAEVNQLNLYNKRNRDFARYFFRGASEVTLDSADRLLLPKRLAEYAGIDKEIILSAYSGRIEIWAQDEYDRMLGEEPGDFSDLAEQVLGEIDQNLPE